MTASRSALFASLAVVLVSGCAVDGCAVDAVAAQDDEPTVSPGPSPGALRCAAELAAASPRPSSVGARVGSWNVRWFPRGRAQRRPAEDADGTDLDWLACSIVRSDLDVVAVQEFVQDLAGRRAASELLRKLEAQTGTPWHARFDDCPDDGRQHVGFLHREDRVRLEDVRTLGDVNPAGGPCAHQLRPGLMASARFASGNALTLLTVHLDSGTAGRDRDNRGESVRELARIAESVAPRDVPLVVLGDWNTMGCQSCDAPHDGAAELASHRASLARGARALRRLVPPEDCSAYYRNRPVVLDHVFATRDLPRGAAVAVGGACARSSCARLSVADRVVLDALSDHCPLVLTVPARRR